MSTTRRPVVVITGANRGLGQETARQLGQRRLHGNRHGAER